MELASLRLRAYVGGRLGNPEAALIADETGFVKEGTDFTGVAKHYTGAEEQD